MMMMKMKKKIFQKVKEILKKKIEEEKLQKK